MATAIETPTGKGSGDENFPVGSFLIAAPLRPHVAAFYAFARAADDIADYPDLAAEDKVARLDRFEAALLGRDFDPALAKAHRLRASLVATGVPVRHPLDLLRAFKRDAVTPRTTDWADLMSYCAVSANPVGRFLLDLHGEATGLWPPNDALCSALQILNHLQDLKPDFDRLDRVYLPQDWLAGEGVAVAALAGTRTAPALRRVIDRCLDGVDALLATAAPLPAALVSRRLGLEAGAILRLATALSRRLRREDPLAGRVVPSRLVFLGTAAWGALTTAAARARG